MSTYYQYQNPSEIGAAPTLDWGSVAQNVNETLQKQEQVRYENREADKKLTNDILTKVSEVNLTSDPTFGELVTKMGFEAKDNQYNLFNKLKKGEISRSDYNITQQNMTSSIAQLNEFSKTYGAKYDQFQKDVAEGKTSAKADFMQNWKGGFQNFKYKKLIPNSTDGRLYIAETDEQGNVKSGPLSVVPMTSLVNVKNFDDKKIDVLAETNRFATQFKPFIDLIRAKGIESVEQLSNMPGYQDFLTNATEAIAKNEDGYASILADTDGTYSFANTDKSVGKTIGLKNNGSGQFVSDVTEDMKKDARKVVERYFLAQTGIKETGTQQFAPRAVNYSGGGGSSKPVKPEERKEAPGVSPLTQSGKVIGATFQPKNIRLQEAKGITGILSAVGLDKSGNLTMSGYNATGTETESYDADGNAISTSAGSKAVKKQKWGGKRGYLVSSVNGAQMDKYIREVINPETGDYFSSVTEAEDFLRRKTKEFQGAAKQTFNAESYYKSKKGKK